MKRQAWASALSLCFGLAAILPAQADPNRIASTFCPGGWRFGVDGTGAMITALDLGGKDPSTLELEFSSAKAKPELTGFRVGENWALDLALPAEAEHRARAILDTGHEIAFTLAFHETETGLALDGFDFNDTGRPCTPAGKSGRKAAK